MSFFSRQWTDAEKWAMGLVSAAIIGVSGYAWRSMQSDVVAEVASKRDRYGRCVDAEVRISNNTSADAADIVLAFDVDYFTRNGIVQLEYGDERDQLIPSGQQTLIQRETYLPVEVKLDPATSTLTVPRLQPGRKVHLFFGGETILDTERAAARERLLVAQERDLMNKPRLAAITRKDGAVVVRRVHACAPE